MIRFPSCLVAAVLAATAFFLSVAASPAAAPVTIARGPLTLTLSPNTKEPGHILELRDARTRRVWIGDAISVSCGTLERVEKTSASSLKLRLLHPQTTQPIDAVITLEEGTSVRFDMDTPVPDQKFGWLNYPPAFRTELTSGALVFCDRSMGLLLPQDDPGYRRKTLVCYANTGCLDMPWIGVVDQARGDGMVLLFHTPVDANVHLGADDKNLIWPQPTFFAAKDRFAYKRSLSLVLTEKGGYVAQARAYRDVARKVGQFRTLADRLKDRPTVAWLKGAPIIWGTSGLEFAAQARAHGIRRGLFNGEGKPTPAELREMRSLGYLTGEYDSYTDIMNGPLGKQRDNVDKVAFRTRDGKPLGGWESLEGAKFAFRSSSTARAAAEKLIPPLLARYPFTARFLDVTPGFQFIEDFHPEHSFDRRRDMEYRKGLLSYFSEIGLVVGGEHGKAWAQPYLDYSEGPMSGSFWWDSKVGHLKRLGSRAEITDKYWKYGMNWRLRVPVWPLTFHDCVVMTWYWGDSNGYLYDIAPELSEIKDLYNILCATPPMMWANQLDYGWNRERDRFLQTYRNTCRFAEAAGFDDMTDHEFLNADRSLQRTRFASGAWAVVNFGDTRKDFSPAGGKPVTLAPHGFLAEGEGVRQSRLMENGVAVTRIEAPEFRSLEADRPVRDAIIESPGLLNVFKVDDGRWNILVRGAGDCGVNLRTLDGFPAEKPYRLVRVDDNGMILEQPAVSVSGGFLRFAAPGPRALYSLLIGVAPEDVIASAHAGEVAAGTTVSLMTGNPEFKVHFALDGTPPSPASPAAKEPVTVSQNMRLRARAFDGDRPVGRELDTTYRAVVPLADTGVVRGKEPPRRVSVSLDGLTELRLLITDGGDNLDFDACDIAGPVLTREDGTTESLTALAVDPERSAIDQWTVVASPDGPPNLATHPPLTGVFPIRGKFTRLELKAGVGGEGRGSVRYILTGVR